MSLSGGYKFLAGTRGDFLRYYVQHVERRIKSILALLFLALL